MTRARDVANVLTAANVLATDTETAAAISTHAAAADPHTGYLKESEFNSSGKNRIINGNFDIWQRGTTGFSTNVGTYTADRWRTDQPITVTRSTDVPSNTLATYSFDVTQSSTSYGTFCQRIEAENIKDVVGQSFTISMYAKSISGASTAVQILIRYPIAGKDDYSSGVTNWQELTIPVTSSWSRQSVTATNASASFANGMEIAIYRGYGSHQTRFSQIQLEIGSTLTPFSRSGGNLHNELNSCMRYFQRISNGADSVAQPINMAQCWSSTNATLPIQFFTPMRVAPTMSVSSASHFQIFNSTIGSPPGITAFSFLQTTPRQTRCDVTAGASILNAGDAGYVGTINASATLDASAEM